VDNLGQIPFRALPAKASEQVRKQISAEYASWLTFRRSANQYSVNFRRRFFLRGVSKRLWRNPEQTQ